MDLIKQLESEYNFLFNYVCKNNKKNSFDGHMKCIVDDLTDLFHLYNIDYIVASDMSRKKFKLYIQEDTILNDHYVKCVELLNRLWEHSVDVFNGVN